MQERHEQVGWLSISLKLVPLIILGVLVLAPAVLSQSALSVTVSTDKTQYSPGETVSISGVVRDSQSNPVFGAEVSIQVNDPGNNLVQVQLTFSSQSGTYVNLFSLHTDALQGQYTIYTTARKSGYGNGQSQAQFTVSPQTSSTSTSTMSSTTSSSTFHTTTTSTSSSTPTTTNPARQCLIATATYGSELAPEVTLLRKFRDFDVLRTSAGENFMRIFNAFYYSFSPGVASFIASQSTIRAGMKIALYPLIGILYLSSLVFAATSFNPELAVSTAGVLGSLGIGAVYLGPILAIVSRFFKSPSSSRYLIAIRLSLIFGISSLLGLLLAEFGHVGILMEITTVGLVLSCIALGGLLVPWSMVRLWSDGRT